MKRRRQNNSIGGASKISIVLKNICISVGIISSQIALPSNSVAASISSATAYRSALIGAGYQTEKESLSAQPCLKGITVPSGGSLATFNFDQTLSEKQASDQLGLSAGGRARFGAVETTGSANFMRNAVSNEYSISSVWLSEYKLPADKLSDISYSEIGHQVKTDITRWSETCGDEYVDEISKGARLFFSIRVDFSSKERKQQFEAKFSISGPLYSAEANLQQASREFGRDVKITVTGLQMGGDVSKLTGIFPNTAEGRANFVQCGLGDLSLCAQVIHSALAYAADVEKGFPSQLKPGAIPGGAPLEYKTAKYSAAGIYLQDGYPFLTDVAREARKRLHIYFENEFRHAVLIDRLIEFGLGDAQLAKVATQRKIVQANLAKITDASRVCYESTEKCLSAVEGLNLAKVDDIALALPALATADYRLITTVSGILSREDSVKIMLKELPTLYGPRRVSLLNAIPGSETSIALVIYGQALKTADLFFENRRLKTFSLERNNESFTEKYGDGYVAIIIQSTRSIIGWLDIDLNEERRKMWIKDVPKGDGTFFLLVRDAFGRQNRFDIEYQKWSRAVENKAGDNPLKIEHVNYAFRNRWWNFPGSGTLLSGDGPWTNTGTAEISSVLKE